MENIWAYTVSITCFRKSCKYWL